MPPTCQQPDGRLTARRCGEANSGGGIGAASGGDLPRTPRRVLRTAVRLHNIAAMPRCAQCPAARSLAGPPIGGPSVVCGVLLREGGAQDTLTEGGEQPHITARHDPSIYFAFCTGDEGPTLGMEELTRRMAADERPQRNYTVCPVWQEEKDRIASSKVRDRIDWSGERYREPESTEDLLAKIAVG